MAEPKLSLIPKNWFLDKDQVIALVTRKKAKAMKTVGSYIRTVARRSIRRRKGKSTPGTPPSAHASGNEGLKRLLYYYEAQRGTLTVGSLKLGGADVAVPGLHEQGGDTVVKVYKKRRNGRRKAEVKSVHRAVYPKRPYMAPALEKAHQEDRLIEPFKDMLG